jgi:2-polyprenyl-3-methyl-5-hydroxy-6-metoxy-1,4-benzoquinol methylase
MSIFVEENGFILNAELGYNERRRNRLEARYRAFLQPVADRFLGKKVLDLASHDGRWSFASLHNGAEHVTGIEYRQRLIDKSWQSIVRADMRARLELIQGDIFENAQRLAAAGRRFDIILCLGIFYHIMDHHLLMKLMTDLAPQLIIMDTSLIDRDEPVIGLKVERGKSSRSAVLDFQGQKETVTGIVSRGGMKMLASSFGYRISWVDWANFAPEDRRGLAEYYRSGRARQKAAAGTEGPEDVRRYSFYLEPDGRPAAAAEPDQIWVAAR